MVKYRKKVCRECGRVYYRRFRRNAGTQGVVQTQVLREGLPAATGESGWSG